MTTRKGLAFVAVVSLSLAAAAALAQAPPTPARPAPAVRTAAYALGMVRGPQAVESYKDLNVVEFTGSGMMNEPAPDGAWRPRQVTRMVGAFAYYLPAARVDIQSTGEGGPRRTIEVVREKLAWNEGRPGMDATPASDVQRRLVQLWMTPHGVLWQALHNPAAVKVSRAGGRMVMTLEVEGTPIKATFDRENRPETVEAPIVHPVLGRVQLVASYSGYKDDGYDTFFPTRILHKIGGRTVLDVNVSRHLSNPYVIFPKPPGMGAS